MIPVVGLAGKARSGKDTLAAAIIAARGGYRYGFADPIKQMTDVFVPRGGDHEKEVVIPELGKSRRQLWQTLGTEWGRDLINPNIWLTIAGWRLQKDGPGMVIADLRFENEADWVRSKRGLVIHVQRPNAAAVHGSTTHASEAGLVIGEQDMIFRNLSTLDYLNRWAESFACDERAA